MKVPWIFKSRKRRSAEKRAKLIGDAKDTLRRRKGNGHKKQGGTMP